MCLLQTYQRVIKERQKIPSLEDPKIRKDIALKRQIIIRMINMIISFLEAFRDETLRKLSVIIPL